MGFAEQPLPIVLQSATYLTCEGLPIWPAACLDTRAVALLPSLRLAAVPGCQDAFFFSLPAHPWRLPYRHSRREVTLPWGVRRPLPTKGLRKAPRPVYRRGLYGEAPPSSRAMARPFLASRSPLRCFFASTVWGRLPCLREVSEVTTAPCPVRGLEQPHRGGALDIP